MTLFDFIICMAVVIGFFISCTIVDVIEHYIRQKRWEEAENKFYIEQQLKELDKLHKKARKVIQEGKENARR